MSKHRKKHLEKQKKKHEEELEHISINMGFHSPASTEYLELERKHKFICSQLDAIEFELSSCQQSSLTNNQRGNRFDKKLPKIDFSKPRNLINKIIDKFASTRKGGSAFF
ncbi:hypothetical protein [Moorena producens]|uniref:hypothetical protein n=1 Tax=Moorena producens TaxID=1155739 RepID=UPI003C73D798